MPEPDSICRRQCCRQYVERKKTRRDRIAVVTERVGFQKDAGGIL